MRRLLLGLALIAAVGWGVAAPQPVAADGWTDVTWERSTPYCGGGTNGCSSLGQACLAVSATWWADPAANLLACDLVAPTRADARARGICCGDVNGAPLGLSCDPGKEPDVNGNGVCVIPKDDPRSCKYEQCGNNESPADAQAGNPISLAEGNKHEGVVDFTTPGPNPLAFIRIYNSQGKTNTGNMPMPLGGKWQSNFDRYLVNVDSTHKTVYRDDGTVIKFTLVSGSWKAPADLPVKLAQVSGNWEFTDIDDTVETYDSTFRLTTIRQRNGYTQTLSYDGTGKLASVTDSYGRTLSFTYTGKRLTTMVAADGGVYTYAYDRPLSPAQTDPDRLIQVTYPKLDPTGTEPNPQITYHYEAPGMHGYLTGITDEKGVRYATWAYNADGRAISSEHAGGADETAITYGTDGSRTVTEPLGHVTIYHYATVQGVKKLSSIERQASTNVPAATTSYTYDTNGFMASRTDFEGHVTTYLHDARGLQTSRTEASGTPQARTITTTWHSTFRVPAQITEPGKTTALTYDTAGRVLTRTETDTRTQTVPYSTNGNARTWTYSWDGTGLLQTVNGPRTDVSDVTTYGWTDGLLTSVTNALGQVTEITAHDLRGLPASVTDPNGDITDLAYNQRGWLVSVTRRSSGGDAATRFEYDAVGQITAIVQPDGVRIAYEYDDARRLTAVENSAGERIEYTLDALGNRTAEDIKASGGTIVKSLTRSYDELGRLLANIGAASQTTAYGYDDNSNTVAITDPLNGATAQAFDALDRLINATDPETGVTDYGYDSQDNLVSVTDPRGVATTYVYDGFGRRIQTASPDAGTTVYQYDAADNLIQTIDGRGVVTQMSYDALNRVSAKTFPASPAENVGYTYDDATPGRHGIGRLATITDESGTTAVKYDARGNVVEEARTIAGIVYTTKYAYDLADRPTQMVYPSGRIVTFARDALGRVASVATQADATAAPVVVASNIQYMPFGPIAALTHGNGLVRSFTYDGDYRLTDLATGDIDTGVQDLAYDYDAADNILSIADNLDASRDQSFTYDDLFRLTEATGAYGTVSYGYDAVGNRTDLVRGPDSETYGYDAFSNRLLSVTGGGGTRNFTYDDAGNIVADDRGGATQGLAYNAANRLKQVSFDGTPDTAYSYNALGERVAKGPAGAPGSGTHFHYDMDGRLIAESDATGALIREYLWLDGLPLGQLLAEAGGGAPPPIDNTDPGATASGSWSAATAGTGYIGSNYYQHEIGVPSGGTIVDNLSPGFFTSGIWAAETSPSGYEGSNYLARDEATGGFGSEIIVDNADATGFTTAGTWTLISNSRAYNDNYVRKAANEISTSAEIVDNADAAFSTVGSPWTIGTGSGSYGANFVYRAWDVSTASIIVDNADPGFAATSGQGWTTSTSTASYGGNYRLHQGDGISVQAQVVDNLDAGFSVTGIWPVATGSSQYGTNFRYHEPEGISPSGGATIVDNTDPGASATGTWTVTTAGSGYYGANYQTHAKTTGSTDLFTWTPTVAATTAYRAYARWRSGNFTASNSAFTIHHAGGSAALTVNQRRYSGFFNYLGTFTLDPGAGHRIELSPNGANNDVVADAVAIEPASAAQPNVATWTLPVTTAGQYRVLARWQADSTYASTATYTVHHAAGSTTVTVNQRANGGQWMLLGTFDLAPGQNHRVELADRNADDYVIADAVAIDPVGAPANSASWTPAIPAAGDYRVFARWVAATGRASNAPFTVTHAGGTTTVTVDQTVNSGKWVVLGTFTFTPGAGHKITLSDQANGFVAADAVAFEPVGSAPNRALWTLPVASTGNYVVWVRSRAASSYASNAPFTVYHAGGTTTVLVNQRTNNGIWVRLGTFPLAPGANHRVELADRVDASTVADGTVIADAVTMEPLDASGNPATWTPALPQRDTYDVYAWWPYDAFHASNAPYTIYHEGGSTTVTTDQQDVNTRARWNLLGTFVMAPGQNHRIDLRDTANATVEADAVRLVAKSETKFARWAISSISQTGSYRVYAKWPASSQHATDAEYTVTYAGGSSTVTVNQRVNGGQWNLLGTFPFNSGGTGYKVELSDNVTTGKVAADAIRYVLDSASSDSFTWTLAVPAAGSYQLYARWVASSANSSAAQ